ncbi:MAG: alpha/beta hydrolase [Holosporaceae bacterium]|jgi:pimeloyl-[acyl-carrier protein] methyl ester esterase|nr:alpha/beta hydrolase [Holosporaceae bacterium]
MTYLLCHGFGFSNKYWRNLIPFLDGEVIFSDDNSDKNRRYVGIGHSIGFQKLNNSGLKFDCLIGLQGFINFCGSDQNTRNERAANLDQMLQISAVDIAKSLEFFYRLCKYPDPIPKNIRADVLMEDLKSMKESYPHCGCPTLIIGSEQDEIVPLSIIKDNFQNVRNVTVEEINDVPHSLGFCEPEEVSQKIENFLEKHVTVDL